MEEMFRRAESSDLGPVCALIDSRIAWMKAAGLRQWDAEDYRRWYSDDYFRSAAANGELFVLCGADGSLHAAGCLRDADNLLFRLDHQLVIVFGQSLDGTFSASDLAESDDLSFQ